MMDDLGYKSLTRTWSINLSYYISERISVIFVFGLRTAMISN